MSKSRYQSKRSQATDIPLEVKKKVWERDLERCVFCGNRYAFPNAHIVPRSKGGLGIEENIITLCPECHHRMDHTTERGKLLLMAETYIKNFYPEWKEEEMTYSSRYYRVKKN